MKYPIGDSEIGYVSQSQFASWYLKGTTKVRAGYFQLNPIYEGQKGYVPMTFKEFKERFPIPSERYGWMRYKSAKYN